MNVWDFGAIPVAQRARENEQLARCENDMALVESRVATGLSI
jgi:hypothetical protein